MCSAKGQVSLRIHQIWLDLTVLLQNYRAVEMSLYNMVAYLHTRNKVLWKDLTELIA